MVDLRRMRYLMNRVPAQIFRIEKARSNASRITQTISDMPHGSGMHSKVEDGYEKIEAAVSAYNDVMEELKEMRRQLEPYIGNIQDPSERAVIRLRYISGYSVRDISTMLYICERQTYRLVQAGEEKLLAM